MDIKALSLAQFMTEESLRLAAFEAWWRKQNAANPQMFPLELEPGLWDEALQTFDPMQADNELAQSTERAP